MCELCHKCGSALAGLEIEDLGRYVLLGVDTADEGEDGASGDALHLFDEVRLRCVLEEHAGVPEALVLAHGDHVPLGGGHAVLERRDDDVRPRVVGSALGGAAAELLLVQTHHRVRQLREVIVRSVPLRHRRGIHNLACSSSSDWFKAARKEEDENQASGLTPSPW